MAGAHPRLLSLTATEESYTGGAHGNMRFEALLWDREANRPIAAAATIGAPALARLTPRYCAALNQEREERRGEPVGSTADGVFNDCPAIEEQVLAPVDGDADGRFDRLDILLPPYAAGSYAEGEYSVALPFEDSDLSGIDPVYRAAFEPGAGAASTSAAKPETP